MQKLLTMQTNQYAIKIDNFEGPLDLLCHLIDKNKMNIYDIKISEITDQYLEYINKAEEINLEVTSEFLIMASTLVYIKSKGLLPKQEETEEEMTEEQLIARIIEYKKYKEITSKFRDSYNEFFGRLYKMPEEINLPKQKLEKEYNNTIIPEIYANLVERNKNRLNQNAENIKKIAITDTFTVASKVKEMFRELIKKPRFVFNKLYSLSKCNKVEVVTAFSGLLELTRRDKVTATQEELFGDIIVEKNKNKSDMIKI
jgi:segregation and condensation protein A